MNLKKLIILNVLFCGLFLSASTAFKFNPIKYSGKKYLSLKEIAKFYGMKTADSNQKATLYSNYSNLQFAVDKKEFFFNGSKIYLASAVLRSKAIALADFEKTVEPLIRTKTVKPHKIYTIVIDPGHGGRDNGTGKNVLEKTVNLKIALKLKYHLQSLGYKVLMTRTKDKFISLNNRSIYANKNNADLFISIHANAAKTAVKGIETFVMTPAGFSSTGSKTADHKTYNGNLYDVNNSRLGYEIQKSLIINTKAKDRGVKKARFAVLKHVKCPAVLIETGFLSNYTERKKLNNSLYQNKIAVAITKGILSYHKKIYAAWKK